MALRIVVTRDAHVGGIQDLMEGELAMIWSADLRI
jgi:hypothetical protein